MSHTAVAFGIKSCVIVLPFVAAVPFLRSSVGSHSKLKNGASRVLYCQKLSETLLYISRILYDCKACLFSFAEKVQIERRLAQGTF